MDSVQNTADTDNCTTTVKRKDTLTRGPEIVDVTLYNSHVFAKTIIGTEFDHQIVQALDRLGVDYILLQNPSISNKLAVKCAGICRLGLERTKIISEIECDVIEARLAVRLGVQGLQIRIPDELSALQCEAWKSTYAAIVDFARSNRVQVSVKIQDVFTTELVELLTTMQELQLQGLQKIVIGDQAGGCHPRQVFQMIELLQKVVQCDIQAGFQDDTGCAIANAFCAVEAGASQIETSVLGIGQRNGVVALGGYLARLIVTNRDHLLATYAPTHLPDIETLVLEAFGLDLPFNNYITGFCAFNHKAGIHMKAVLNNPQTYESIRPDDFGVSRNVQYASRLTGWNAIKSRATQMNLTMTDEQCRSCTEIIKSMADQRTISNQEVDRTLRLFAEGVFEQDSSVLHQESSVVGQRSSAVSRSGPVSVS